MSDAPLVTFARSGRQAAWTESARALLDFAEAQGLDPAFSCRAGVCGTCRTRVLRGEVAYIDEPLDDPGPDHVLICCSKPRGPVTLDL